MLDTHGDCIADPEDPAACEDGGLDVAAPDNDPEFTVELAENTPLLPALLLGDVSWLELRGGCTPRPFPVADVLKSLELAPVESVELSIAEEPEFEFKVLAVKMPEDWLELARDNEFEDDCEPELDTMLLAEDDGVPS